MPDPSLIAKSRLSYVPEPTRARAVGSGFGVFLVLALVFLLIVGALYGGAVFYRRSLEQNLDGLTKELSQLEEDFHPDEIIEMARVDKGLSIARSLLQRHVYASNLFDILEEHTIDSVFYKQFTYMYENGGTVAVVGVAKGFEPLHQQVALLKSLPSVTNVTLENVTLADDGAVEFKSTIGFDANTFTLRTP